MNLSSLILASALVCGCVSCGTTSTGQAVKEQSYHALVTAKGWYDTDLLGGDEYQRVKDRLIAGAPTTNLKALESELVRIKDLYDKDTISSDDASKLREKVIAKYLGRNPME
jgi:hypothetical protein